MVDTKRRRSVERFVAGDIVIIQFPFTNLEQVKQRPALVIRSVENDVILSQVTSKFHADAHSIVLTKSDFVIGGSSLDKFC